MMTLTMAPWPWLASTTPWISRFTTSRSPPRSAPMLITMSISSAPSRNAASVSATFAAVLVAPSGKPTTVQTFTGESAQFLRHHLGPEGVDANAGKLDIPAPPRTPCGPHPGSLPA